MMTLILIAICIVGIWVGKITTEHPKVSLPQLFPKLNIKPFNCRPCLTFHLLWIGYAFTGFLKQSIRYTVIGIVIAIIVFIVLKLKNNSLINK